MLAPELNRAIFWGWVCICLPLDESNESCSLKGAAEGAEANREPWKRELGPKIQAEI